MPIISISRVFGAQVKYSCFSNLCLSRLFFHAYIDGFYLKLRAGKGYLFKIERIDWRHRLVLKDFTSLLRSLGTLVFKRLRVKKGEVREDIVSTTKM